MTRLLAVWGAVGKAMWEKIDKAMPLMSLEGRVVDTRESLLAKQQRIMGKCAWLMQW